MKAARFLRTPALHWAQATRDILISAGAAGVAWWLGTLLGHPRPVFAAIAAVVCLAPGVASHGRQAVGMLVGVTIGIVAGEAALSLPILTAGGADMGLKVATVMLVALFAAASFGLNAVMIIQSGASAAIVIGAGQRGPGFERIGDAATGAAIGLLCSQVLFSPDPLTRIARARADLHRAIATAGDNDPHERAAAIRRHAATLETVIGAAAGTTRWTLRGRWQARAVAEAIVQARHDVEQVAPAAGLAALRFRSPADMPISRPMQRTS
jgi:hypothetical protein